MIGKRIRYQIIFACIAVTVVYAAPAWAQWIPVGNVFVPIAPSRPTAPPPPTTTTPSLVEPGNTMLGTTGMADLAGTREGARTLQTTVGTQGIGAGMTPRAGSRVSAYMPPPTDTEMALAASVVTVRPVTSDGYGGAAPRTPDMTSPAAMTAPFGGAPVPVFGTAVSPADRAGVGMTPATPSRERITPGPSPLVR